MGVEKERKKNFYAGALFLLRFMLVSLLILALSVLLCLNWGIGIDFPPAWLTDLISKKARRLSGPLGFDSKNIKLKYIVFRKEVGDMGSSESPGWEPFVIGHCATRWFTPWSTGQSGTQWTQTLTGSLAPSDYWRMRESWSHTERSEEGQSSWVPRQIHESREARVQGKKKKKPPLRTERLLFQLQIYDTKTQTKGISAIT